MKIEHGHGVVYVTRDKPFTEVWFVTWGETLIDKVFFRSRHRATRLADQVFDDVQ